MTLSAHTLLGQRIVVIHEDPFQRGYLTDVLCRTGAAIAGSAGGLVEGLALLDTEPAPSALVLSGALRDGAAALARAAGDRGIPTLIVGPAKERIVAGPNQRSLPAPFAAFQVVEALCALLECPPAGHPAVASGARLRGH